MIEMHVEQGRVQILGKVDALVEHTHGLRIGGIGPPWGVHRKPDVSITRGVSDRRPLLLIEIIFRPARSRIISVRKPFESVKTLRHREGKRPFGLAGGDCGLIANADPQSVNPLSTRPEVRSQARSTSPFHPSLFTLHLPLKANLRSGLYHKVLPLAAGTLDILGTPEHPLDHGADERNIDQQVLAKMFVPAERLVRVVKRGLVG